MTFYPHGLLNIEMIRFYLAPWVTLEQLSYSYESDNEQGTDAEFRSLEGHNTLFVPPPHVTYEETKAQKGS